MPFTSKDCEGAFSITTSLWTPDVRMNSVKLPWEEARLSGAASFVNLETIKALLVKKHPTPNKTTLTTTVIHFFILNKTVSLRDKTHIWWIVLKMLQYSTAPMIFAIQLDFGKSFLYAMCYQQSPDFGHKQNLVSCISFSIPNKGSDVESQIIMQPINNCKGRQ